jgi:hypothetical protein
MTRILLTVTLVAALFSLGGCWAYGGYGYAHHHDGYYGGRHYSSYYGYGHHSGHYARSGRYCR